MHSNRLIHEKSPYLLQHANNPVDWYPWGNEAFEKAKAEDKVIFLSIGYATCHWCHVMERESFEDEATAKIMNDLFICIKMDREERPDIDRIYMDAIHAMNQQGGWPLNLFLTPDLKPFTGGTYFPPVRRYGMKSFSEVLLTVNTFWSERKLEMLQVAEELTQVINGSSNKSEFAGELPSNNIFHYAYKQFESHFDNKFYGFKTNSQNKFPPSMGLSFLMTYYKWSKNDRALEIAELTLQAMKRGGIYDQLGGGLSRYSTDHEWMVPHFEKMLYDNSLFLNALVEAWQITKKDFYKDSAIDLIQYIERDLRTSEGGISCAEDADSENEEGKFYIWSYSELKSILGENFEKIAKFWNITKTGNFEHKNIFHESIQEDRNSIINSLGGESFLNTLGNSKKILLEERSKRIRPLRDDKILMSWNCLYIQALTLAGASFQNAEYISLAEKTFHFVTEKLTDSDGIYRRYRDSERKYRGTLTDYAEYGLSAMKLFSITQNIDYIEKSIHVAQMILAKFSTSFGPFYETESDQENLIRRNIDGYDGVEPSGNSATTRFFLSLLGIGQMHEILSKSVEGIFSFFNNEISRQGLSFPYMLRSYLEFKELSEEWVIVYPDGDKNTTRIKEVLNKSFLPGRHFVLINSKDYSKSLQLIPILEGRSPSQDIDIYFCKNRTCDLPSHNIDSILNRI
jgi:uncharacterized protein YyaL (SSP411 family)